MLIVLYEYVVQGWVGGCECAREGWMDEGECGSSFFLCVYMKVSLSM